MKKPGYYNVFLKDKKEQVVRLSNDAKYILYTYNNVFDCKNISKYKISKYIAIDEDIVTDLINGVDSYDENIESDLDD